MAWVESDQAIRGHKKTKRLCRALLIRPREAWGILHGLWWWAYDNAKSGLIEPVDFPAIADACDWGGPGAEEETPERLIAGFLEAGWIDLRKGQRGRVFHKIHDWEKHGGKLHARKEQQNSRNQAYRKSHRINGNETVQREERDKREEIDKKGSTTTARANPAENSEAREPEPGTPLRTIPGGLSPRELERKRQEFQRLAKKHFR